MLNESMVPSLRMWLLEAIPLHEERSRVQRSQCSSVHSSATNGIWNSYVFFTLFHRNFLRDLTQGLRVDRSTGTVLCFVGLGFLLSKWQNPSDHLNLCCIFVDDLCCSLLKMYFLNNDNACSSEWNCHSRKRFSRFHFEFNIFFVRVSLCSVLLVYLLTIGWGVDRSNTLREKKKQMLGSVMTTKEWSE